MPAPPSQSTIDFMTSYIKQLINANPYFAPIGYTPNKINRKFPPGVKPNVNSDYPYINIMYKTPTRERFAAIDKLIVYVCAYSNNFIEAEQTAFQLVNTLQQQETATDQFTVYKFQDRAGILAPTLIPTLNVYEVFTEFDFWIG
jgi:hypothetical protein